MSMWVKKMCCLCKLVISVGPSGTKINPAERGKLLKVGECGMREMFADASTHAHARTHKHRLILSAFWDTGCRRQAGMTGQDMLITDTTGHLTDGTYVCVYVYVCIFDRQTD